MTESFQILLITMLAFVACNAEPPRFRSAAINGGLRTRRFLARQQEADDLAPTPYPPAGIKPEIPFDLPTEEAANFPPPSPENTIGQPDQTYGPPDQTYGPPDLIYGPPEPEEEFAPEEVTNAPTRQTSSNGRAGQRSKAAAFRKTAKFHFLTKAAKLQVIQSKLPLLAKLKPIIAKPFLFADGSIAYSAQLQRW